MKMKKIVSMVICLCILCSAASVSVSAVYDYDPTKALSYAKAHWNDGVGMCAEFVSKCVVAGGVKIGTIYTAGNCFKAIINNSKATKHQLTLDSKGRAMKSSNSSILNAGDVVVQYCTTCGKYPHILIFNKYATDGEALFYAHAGARNGEETASAPNTYDGRHPLNINTAYHPDPDCNVIAYVAHFPEATHSHSYALKYEATHPHKSYYICSCGSQYTASHSTVSTYYSGSYPYDEYYSCTVTSCSYHNTKTGNNALPEKPVLQNMKAKYFTQGNIVFNWTGTGKATTSEIHIEKDMSYINGLGFGEWETHRRISGVVSGIATTLTAGRYRVSVENINTNVTPTDGNECKTVSDYAVFEVLDKPEKPYLKNMKNSYEKGEAVTFGWDSSETATHYNLYYDKLIDGEYVRQTHDFYAQSGMQKTFDEGQWRVLLQATNSNYWTSDGSTWVYTDSDWVTFAVGNIGGSCGANASWTLTEDGVLSITGSGELNEYDAQSVPWYQYKNQITAVVIEGVTADGLIFNEYTNLKTASLSDTTTIMPSFCDCTSLEKVNVPNGVTYTGSLIFCNCTSLEEITLPETLTVIGDVSFSGCTKLKKINIPEGVTRVGQFAFNNTALEEITIPDSVTNIGGRTFGGCSKLKKVTIGKSITSIPGSAFAGCSNLTDVYYRGTEEQWGNVTIYDGNDYLKNATLHFVEPVTGVGIVVPVSSPTENFQPILKVGESVKLEAGVTPSNAYNREVIWSSSDESIAKVENGKVTAVNPGTAAITVKTVDGGFTKSIEFTVVLPVERVELNPKEEQLVTGELTKLVATVYPENATNKNVIWTTSDDSVVTVQNGIITAVGAGTATIEVITEDGGHTSSCTVTVAEPVVNVTEVSLDTEEWIIGDGETVSLTATVYPENATNKNITWKSSDEGVATVEEGVVTAVGTGTAIITVTTEDGGFTATCVITVEAEPEPEPEPEPEVTSPIADIATLRCYSASFSDDTKKIAIKVDRFPVINKSGSLGLAIIPADGYEVSYTLTGDNSKTTDKSKLSKTNTDKYTLLSTGVNAESGGGSLGKIPLQIITKGDATRIYLDVVLTNGVNTVTYKLTVSLSDLAVEGDVDIKGFQPLRSVRKTFVIDNDAKTIYYETEKGVTSAGFAVSVDNDFTKATRPRRILTAKSGMSLAHGDIKTSGKDVYDRYVVARRSVGETQTYKVKVHGGEDGLTYTWYTVTVVFK